MLYWDVIPKLRYLIMVSYSEIKKLQRQAYKLILKTEQLFFLFFCSHCVIRDALWLNMIEHDTECNRFTKYVLWFYCCCSSPHFCGDFMYVSLLILQLSNISWGRWSWLFCCNCALHVTCVSLCSLSLSQGAMGWSVVYDSGISWQYLIVSCWSKPRSCRIFWLKLIALLYSKTCVKRSLKNRQNKFLMTKTSLANGSLMKIESIAESSLWDILQYFRHALNGNMSWKPFWYFCEWPFYTGFTVYWSVFVSLSRNAISWTVLCHSFWHFLVV